LKRSRYEPSRGREGGRMGGGFRKLNKKEESSL